MTGIRNWIHAFNDGRSSWGFFIVCVLLSAFLIFVYSEPAEVDQSVLVGMSFPGWPKYEAGIVSQLIAAGYTGVFSIPEKLINNHIRIIALLVFTVPAFLLAQLVLRNQWNQILFTAVLFSSRYPFLWLSSELFAAGFLFLTVFLVIKNAPVQWTVLALVLMSFSKPDLILIGLVFMGYLLWDEQYIGFRKKILGYFGLFVFLLNIPGFFIHGLDHLTGPKSFHTFSQHYAALVEKHQISSAPNPWRETEEYMQSVFPEASSVRDIILKYPSRYIDFVFLSLASGLKRALVLFHVFLVLIPVLLISAFTKKWRVGHLEKLFALSLIALIPFVVFSFPHIRYMARFYPVLMLIILVFYEQFSEEKAGKFVVGTLLVGLSIQSVLLIQDILKLDTLQRYWFPD